MWEHTVRRHLANKVSVVLLFLVVSTLTCVKIIPVEAQAGRFIDVFTQKGGVGVNQSSDMFQPQELVTLYALVTFNDNPVASKLVSFKASGPLNALQNMTAGGSSLTNEGGIAEFSFRIPWPSTDPEKKVFGEWNVISTVDIADVRVVDTLTFLVGWIVKITNIATLDAELRPEVYYLRQSTIVFNLTVLNSARTAKPSTITIDVQDSAGHPIIHIQLDNLILQPGLSYVNASATIPLDASIGRATVSAAPYTAPIELGGVLYSPAIATTFEIVTIMPLTYLVTFAQTGLDARAIGTVVTVNGSSKGFADLPFTVRVNNGSILTYSYSNVSSSVNYTEYVLTGVVGPSSPMTVTGDATVTGNYVVQVTAPKIPVFVILGLFFGLILIAAVVALLFLLFLGRIRRRKRKKPAQQSYVIIVHPHI
jgi:uncharacterized membrane protein